MVWGPWRSCDASVILEGRSLRIPLTYWALNKWHTFYGRRIQIHFLEKYAHSKSFIWLRKATPTHTHTRTNVNLNVSIHDDVIKWKLFPRYWPFVRRIHRFPVNSPHKGQWRGALMLSLICVWINDWVNNGEAGDLRRYRIHYDVTVM